MRDSGFVLFNPDRDFAERKMPDLDFTRAEIERVPIQVGRQRREILQLQRAGYSTISAEALLQRMFDRIDGLWDERDRLKTELPARRAREQAVKHFRDDSNPPPFVKALAELRPLATREGWCYQHVQVITVAIDQYAEKGAGQSGILSQQPYGIGGGRQDIP